MLIPPLASQLLLMAAIVYRCPNTGLNVQGFTADDPTDADTMTYEPMVCAACTRVHLVNPATRKVLETGDE
jgi:hypothetical protein